MSLTHIAASLRRLVHERAAGVCEYCLTPESLSFQSHQIDHIIAEKHGGLTKEGNLALSCILCNQTKGSDLTSIDPLSSNIVPLFNPRKDQWSDHFLIKDSFILPKTDVGRATVRLLQLNAPDRVVERGWMLAAGEIVVPS